MYEYRCQVKRVVDGDTVDLIIDLGFSIYTRQRVRLEGIDAPENRTRDLEEKKKGILASEFLNELLAGLDGLKVRTTMEKGKFGRVIGDIMYPTRGGWMSVSRVMVDNGHAVEKDYA